ncbi:MAG: metallophosphoesterase, partial [Fimbriimonadaceae bacterium]|nr:metallophosphoesterase [Fimbriimonadaceae bacterium]
MKRLTRRQALRLGFYGSLAGLGLDAFVIEPRWLQFERHEIPIKGLGKDLDGYRIALLSDV